MEFPASKDISGLNSQSILWTPHNNENTKNKSSIKRIFDISLLSALVTLSGLLFFVIVCACVYSEQQEKEELEYELKWIKKKKENKDGEDK